MMIFMHDWEVAAVIVHLRIEITFFVTFFVARGRILQLS